jgi:hypothetical protein
MRERIGEESAKKNNRTSLIQMCNLPTDEYNFIAVVEGKYFLVLKYASWHEEIWGRGCMAPYILELGSGWRRVVCRATATFFLDKEVLIWTVCVAEWAPEQEEVLQKEFLRPSGIESPFSYLPFLSLVTRFVSPNSL